MRQENAILRQQIASLTGEDIRLPSNRWVALLIVGWLLLTILPTMAVWLTSFETQTWSGYVGYGIAFGAPWLQCSILFSVLVLLNVNASPKLLIFVLASVGLCACWLSTRNLTNESFQYALLGPFVSSLIVTPTIACRIVFRWRIVHGLSQRQGRPVSIATYLFLTLIVAALISAMSWLPKDLRDGLLDGSYFVYFGGLIISSIMISIPTMVFILNRLPLNRLRGIYSLCIWELISLAISVISMYCIGRFEAPRMSLLYGLFGASFGIFFSLGFTVAMLWLRLLGFRLQRYNGRIQGQPL